MPMTVAGSSQTEFPPVELPLRDGRRVTLRPVQPDDKFELQAFLKRLSEQSRYSRFMSSMRELSSPMLERAVNPESGRELQFVAVCEEGALPTIVGGARYSAAPGSKDCEFAFTVADEWQG